MTRGFTLIELLVVVGIIALVAGMLAGSMTRRGEDAEVAKVAQQLAWDLRRARALAIQTGGVHGIAINMPTPANQAPSNQAGDHWYRMFGPSPKLMGGMAQNSIPVADYYSSALDNPYRPKTFGEVTTAILQCWRGDQIFLPRNKVRFLALADTDEGVSSLRSPTGDPSYPGTYPRPWFGYFKSGTWYPWGQGYRIEADAHDFIICFLPNGAAIVPEFMRNRRYYSPNSPGTCKAKPDMSKDNGKGAADYPKPDEIRSFVQPEAYERPAWECWWDIPEVAHFTRHTGGWFITVATDGDGNTTFASAEEVLQSILPAFRVFVGRNGSVAVYKVRRQEGFVKGQTNAQKWSNITVNNRCRLAYLHASASTTEPWPFQPVGMPITDRIEKAMLTDRIWWIDNP